jgi:hypothetical protein
VIFGLSDQVFEKRDPVSVHKIVEIHPIFPVDQGG